MAAVAVVAVVLAILRSGSGVLLCVVLLYLASGYLFYRGIRESPGLAGLVFTLVGAAVNVLCIAFSVFPYGLTGLLFVALTWFLGLPLITGPGCIWARQPAPATAGLRRSPYFRWAMVVVVCLAPLSIFVSPWPFQLAFLASRPALERLADAVSEGQPVQFPARAGLFHIAVAVVDRASGNVALLDDSSPGRRSGFVRPAPGSVSAGPLTNLQFHARLTHRWWYGVED